MYGGKVGYFFSRLNWLGVETEAFTTTPHVKQQFTTISFLGAPLVSGTGIGNHFRVTTWALNLIARYPGERFQPYAGAGLGVFFARMSDLPGSSSDTAPGLNALAGARFLIAKQVALFGEYKYNRATFEFDELLLKGDYSAHHLSSASGTISSHVSCGCGP